MKRAKSAKKDQRRWWGQGIDLKTNFKCELPIVLWQTAHPMKCNGTLNKELFGNISS